MSEKNIKLIIACHKPCEVPEDSLYVPVFVGSAGKASIPGFERDDTGENISSLNPVFCEMTGLYWAWKNLDADYLGLVHYRRYFTEKSRLFRKKNGALESVLTEEEAEALLEKYKVIVPRKRHYYIESVYSHYSHTFDGSQFDLTRQILQEKDPDSVPAWDRLMRGSSAWLYNMFLMDRAMADDYCAWVFDILFELTKRVDTSGMSAFDRRFAGRVSERLLNVWLIRQTETGRIRRQEIREVPYLYLGKVNWGRKIAGFLEAKFFHKKYKQSF